LTANVIPFKGQTTRRQQCTAKSKRTGVRCEKWAVNGAMVCRFHGAAKGTPARKKAEQQLREARDELMEMLLQIARDESVLEKDRLKAIQWALERSGFRAGVEVDVTLKPWQAAIAKLVGDDSLELDISGVDVSTDDEEYYE
jgi:hypothetical protein